MKFEKLLDLIKRIDFSKLPGKDAHLKAMPRFNEFPFRSLTPREDSLKSAVMILIVPDEDADASVILTVRSERLGSHSGQISFPGGRLEDGEAPLDAALRETFEEIGVETDSIEVIAQLSDFFVLPSNSVVTPFIGLLNQLPDFVINEDEVQEILLVKLDFLMNEENLKNESWDFKSFSADVPHWKVHKEKNLWGATAMIISEFLELLKRNTIS